MPLTRVSLRGTGSSSQYHLVYMFALHDMSRPSAAVYLRSGTAQALVAGRGQTKAPAGPPRCAPTPCRASWQRNGVGGGVKTVRFRTQVASIGSI